MRYVIDASVAAIWVLRSPLMAKARQLRDEYRRHVHDLIAPAHFSPEIANALTKAERQRLIPVGNARTLIADVLNTAPVLHVIDPLFSRAVDLSSQTRSAFYDCLYVALAEREGCEFVTIDDKLIRNLQAQFPFIIHLAAVP